MANAVSGHKGTLWQRAAKKGCYIIGAKIAGVHKQTAVARGMAMFALKGEVAKDSEVHHNDQNRLNDLPSNLAICTKKQHRILDALSLLRNSGFEIPLRPTGEYHPMLVGVVWLIDLLEDHDKVIEEAILWVKDFWMEQHGWSEPNSKTGEIERRV